MDTEWSRSDGNNSRNLNERLPTDQSTNDARRITKCIHDLYQVVDRMPLCSSKIVLHGAITDLSYVASVLYGEFDGKYR